MSKWTPGPWFAVQPENANGWWIVSRDIDGCDSVDESGDGGFEMETARLIAAAPDMYEALENLENDDGSIPFHAWNMIQSALTKARGE